MTIEAMPILGLDVGERDRNRRSFAFKKRSNYLAIVGVASALRNRHQADRPISS